MWFRLRPHLDIARTLHFSVGRFIGVVSRLKIYWQLVPKRAHPHSSGDWRQVVDQPEMIGVLATRSGQEAVERSSRRLSSERGPHGAERHIRHATRATAGRAALSAAAVQPLRDWISNPPDCPFGEWTRAHHASPRKSYCPRNLTDHAPGAVRDALALSGGWARRLDAQPKSAPCK